MAELSVGKAESTEVGRDAGRCRRLPAVVKRVSLTAHGSRVATGRHWRT